MSVILRRLQNARFMEFSDLFDTSRGVPVVVVNFIAMLELCARIADRDHPGRAVCADLRATRVFAGLTLHVSCLPMPRFGAARITLPADLSFQRRGAALANPVCAARRHPLDESHQLDP